MVEAAKSTINKYVKRERGKTLSADADFWDFRCKLGLDSASAETVHLKQLLPEIDKLVVSQPESFYVEIQAFEANRIKK